MIKVKVHITDRMIGKGDQGCRHFRVQLRSHLLEVMPQIDDLTITSEPSKSFVKVDAGPEVSLYNSVRIQREVYKRVVEFVKQS